MPLKVKRFSDGKIYNVQTLKTPAIGTEDTVFCFNLQGGMVVGKDCEFYDEEEGEKIRGLLMDFVMSQIPSQKSDAGFVVDSYLERYFKRKFLDMEHKDESTSEYDKLWQFLLENNIEHELEKRYSKIGKGSYISILSTIKVKAVRDN